MSLRTLTLGRRGVRMRWRFKPILCPEGPTHLWGEPILASESIGAGARWTNKCRRCGEVGYHGTR